MNAPELEIAATVTRVAVSCSAWLGVAVIGLTVSWLVLEWRILLAKAESERSRLAMVSLRVLVLLVALGSMFGTFAVVELQARVAALEQAAAAVEPSN